MSSLRDVPGYLELPLVRRLRVRALVTLARRLTRPEAGTVAVVASVRSALPQPLALPIRRALAPLRLASRRTARLSQSSLPDVALAARGGPPRASIIVATRGAPSLGQCLAALEAFTNVAHELIVVDDASAVPLLLPDHAIVHRHRSVRGFVASANRGASLASTDTLVFLNDDAVVTPGWLEAMLGVLGQARAGLAGPASNDTGDAATGGARYDTLDGLLAHAANARGGVREVAKLSLFCAAIPRRLFERIGGLDEGYGLGGFEDDELCAALHRRGRRVLLCPDAYVHHHGSLTFGALDPAARIARFEVNRRRFERRWGARWRAPATPVG